MARTRCPGHGRHWFALWGAVVGVRTPTCQRCGAPNPRPLSATEQAEYEGVLRQRERVHAPSGPEAKPE